MEKENLDLVEIQLKNQIFEEILGRKILLKLKNNLSYFIDGRIIKFSELIRLHSCNARFENKLSYESIDRKILIIIVEFLEIIQWKYHQYTFDSMLPELDCWYNYNKHLIKEVESMAKYLKIVIIQDFLRYYANKEQRILRENGFFKTLVNVIPVDESTFNRTANNENSSKALSKDFEQAEPPEENSIGKSLSFAIPIKIYQVKMNANKNNNKAKFNYILKDKELDALIDAKISDSFWLIVMAFKYEKIQNNKKDKEKEFKLITNILKRLSQNYFNFFIKLCEFNKHQSNDNLNNVNPNIKNNLYINNNNSSSNNNLTSVLEEKVNESTNNSLLNAGSNSKNAKHYGSNLNNIKTVFNKDNILDVFYDYMAQCVFYSLYLAFPKSRQKFNYEFKQLLVSFFGYLFNGLNVHNKYNTDHWELDLGSGNIIEPEENKKKLEQLPNITFFESLVKSQLKGNEKYGSIGKKLDTVRAKNLEKNRIIMTTILNTPLYRMYAETFKFETLNMIRPIKLKQRKMFDTMERENRVNQNAIFAANSLKKAKDLSKDFIEFKKENQRIYNAQHKEITANIQRLNKEFGDIKSKMRNSEYTNYCIFIYSK